jgi:integrase
MATFKAIVRKGDRRKDGTWNVKIRVIHNREIKVLSTPFYVTQAQLTRGLAIKDVALLDKLDQHLIELRAKVVQLGFQVEHMNVDELVSAIESYHNECIDMIEFMRNYADDLKGSHRTNTSNIYHTAINSLYRFNGNKPLYAHEMTAQFMYDYFMSIQNLKNNTIRSYLICLRTMYKAAQLKYNNDDAGIVNIKHGVFKLIKIPQQNDSDKGTLNSQQIQAIIDVPYTGSWYCDFAKDMFLLSFMCFGMNVQDLFFAKKSQYQDGILSYRRQKVSRVKKEADMKIKVPDAAKVIIEKYSGDKEYLIDFQGHKRSVHVCRYIHATFQNAGLEPEGDYLSKVGHKAGEYVFYGNRHAMATIALNECGIDYMTVHRMLNHATPQSFRTTDVYIQKDYTQLWKANEKLMSLFDWGFYLESKDMPK